MEFKEFAQRLGGVIRGESSTAAFTKSLFESILQQDRLDVLDEYQPSSYKINLYLGLKVCDAHGIDTVFMDADLNNPASQKTMEALGGTRIREYYDATYAHCMVVDYNIEVKKALRDHPEFEEIICPIEDIF